MLTFGEIRSLVAQVRRQAGNPPFKLWSWKSVCHKLPSLSKDEFGVLAYGRVLAVNPHQTQGNALNTIWHEIGHLLYPWKPHWWIECYAQRMSCRDYHGRREYWFGYYGPYTLRAKKLTWFFGFPYAADLLRDTRIRAAALRRRKAVI